ncbi:MAG: ferrous iron transport protein B [Candidatus Alcyoniella australis]|nr:ferrous iron transport protein B [Candidatus Alcyoniella australis]
MKRITIALAGNPNSGKTTIFNALTGARQKVGNWGGVTVERKQGHLEFEGYEVTVVDLPGTYSLTAYSIEELVARNYIVDERPDVVVDIVDAGNLERNLYLTTQLVELSCPLVIALNMMDVAEQKGLKIAIGRLSEIFGAPLVPTVGSREKGLESLLRACIEVVEGRNDAIRPVRIPYGSEVEGHLAELTQMLPTSQIERCYAAERWMAIKLLENDRRAIENIAEAENSEKLLLTIERLREHLVSLYGDDPELLFAERRYGFIAGALKETLTETLIDRVSVSEQIDRVLTNRLFGLPLFALMVWAMFQFTFTVGAYPMDWLDIGVSWLGRSVGALLPAGLLRGLIVEGVIGGVGSVLVFMPNILLLFLCISFLEDSGYMARAAFLMDRVMHLLGLHGKSFIPLLMGFGCTVPAVMATRTLESERDRILTIMINPLMSCSARLPVYVLLAGAFFPPARAGTVIFSIYLLGALLAVLVGRLFSKTILRGQAAPFVMELPPYRLPTFKTTAIHMWERSKIFVRKMGGVILVGSIVIWFLGAFPVHGPRHQELTGRIDAHGLSYGLYQAGANSKQRLTIELYHTEHVAQLQQTLEADRIAESYIGRIGRTIEPIFAPLGLDWRAAVAVLTGFVAKEIVVSTLGVLMQVDDEQQPGNAGLIVALRNTGMTPLIAYAFMAFILIYTPCLATVAAIRRETNSRKWAAFSVAYSFVLAWVVAFSIKSVGGLLGF